MTAVTKATIACDLSLTTVMWAADALNVTTLDGLTVYASIDKAALVVRINREVSEIAGKLKFSAVPSEILQSRDTWAISTPDGRMFWSQGL